MWNLTGHCPERVRAPPDSRSRHAAVSHRRVSPAPLRLSQLKACWGAVGRTARRAARPGSATAQLRVPARYPLSGHGTTGKNEHLKWARRTGDGLAASAHFAPLRHWTFPFAGFASPDFALCRAGRFSGYGLRSGARDGRPRLTRFRSCVYTSPSETMAQGTKHGL